ncbi:MAG TPA: dihydrolipoamide acetyltransferase family protein [Anaerolineales bacterium]|nr:dihydrolipoamide acetyltransferase family protein [Anaerolineales bacterium]
MEGYRMATRVIMPQLGESVVEGTVTKWLKNEGETVAEFEALLEVNTDKVDTEVPAPASGTVIKVYVGAGQTVRAGALLAAIGQPGEAAPEAETPSPVSHPSVAAQTAGVDVSPHPTLAPALTPPRERDLGFISPIVARIAAEHEVDLSLVRGTGQGRRITKKDVLAFLEARHPGLAAPSGIGIAAPAGEPWEQPASGELFRPTEEVFGPKTPATAAAPAGRQIVQPFDVVRRTIAEHMLRSKHTSPHVTTVMEADLSRVVAHREASKETFARDGANLTFSTYFVAASIAALKAMPIVNASWSEAGIVFHQQVNIGLAVSLGEHGLIVPVIKDADQKSLLGLTMAVQDLSTRARARQLKPDEVREGTFTITNHGVSGSLFATPIINQPQCAILGVGAIQKRVVVVESSLPGGEKADALAIRPMVYLTLTFDHRILDGAIADSFLAKVVAALQGWS